MATEHQAITLRCLLERPEMQIRGGTDPQVVDRYSRAMAAGVQFPPIKVARLGDALELVDGFHRTAAMRSLGIKECVAEVIAVASLKEARWEAAKANSCHGLPLKPKQFREVFRAYVAAGQHRQGTGFKSYRVIAAELGGLRSYTTIRNWMRSDFPAVFARMRDDEEECGATGGLRPPRQTRDPESEVADLALKGLDAVAVATEAVTRPILLDRIRARHAEVGLLLKCLAEEEGLDLDPYVSRNLPF